MDRLQVRLVPRARDRDPSRGPRGVRAGARRTRDRSPAGCWPTPRCAGIRWPGPCRARASRSPSDPVPQGPHPHFVCSTVASRCRPVRDQCRWSHLPDPSLLTLPNDPGHDSNPRDSTPPRGALGSAGSVVWVTSDVELRRRIVQAAAELFTEHGYEGTRIRMVAQRAEVTPRTVRRLTGGRAQLFAIVIAETVTSAGRRPDRHGGGGGRGGGRPAAPGRDHRGGR